MKSINFIHTIFRFVSLGAAI